MTSHRSDNLDALITFQGQESRMQDTRMTLWTKSRWALSKLSRLASQNWL